MPHTEWDDGRMRKLLRELDEGEEFGRQYFGDYDPDLYADVLEPQPSNLSDGDAVRGLIELANADLALQRRKKLRSEIHKRRGMEVRLQLEREFDRIHAQETKQAGLSWPELLIGVSLSPFLQSIASAYGTRAAGSFGPWARRRVRRLIRREIGSATRSSREPGRRREALRPVLQLEHENGVKVVLDDSTPVEAVTQLLQIDFLSLGSSYDHPPHLIWLSDWQLWCAQGTRGGEAFYSTWDPDQGDWRHGSLPGSGNDTSAP
ncbi:hypothetical protein [Streptomyces sp. NPDC054837]